LLAQPRPGAAAAIRGYTAASQALPCLQAKAAQAAEAEARAAQEQADARLAQELSRLERMAAKAQTLVGRGGGLAPARAQLLDLAACPNKGRVCAALVHAGAVRC
jgi:hypothetical protein